MTGHLILHSEEVLFKDYAMHAIHVYQLSTNLARQEYIGLQ